MFKINRTTMLAGLAVMGGIAIVGAPACSDSGTSPLDSGPSSDSGPKASVTVTLDSSSLAVGGVTQAHAVAKDSTGTVIPGTATWTSSNPSVATVSTAGAITAQSAGSASIQGTIDGITGAASLTVTASGPPDPLAEPTFNTTQSTMLWDENFDAYTFDTLHPPCGGTVPNHTIIDHSWGYCKQFTTDGGPGVDTGVTVIPGRSGNAAAWHYDGIYQETHGVVTTDGSLPYTGKKMTVVQYWAQFTPDSGFSLTTKDNQGNWSAIVQIKNIMLWNDQNRFQWDMHAHAGGCSLYGPSYTMIGGIESVDVGCNSDQPIGPFIGTYGDGQWHRWTVEYQPQSVVGARDGIARLWIDGILTNNLEKSVCGVTPAGGWKSWCDPAELDGLVGGSNGVGVIEWGANRTDGSGIKFTMAIDDFKWWVSK